MGQVLQLHALCQRSPSNVQGSRFGVTCWLIQQGMRLIPWEVASCGLLAC